MFRTGKFGLYTWHGLEGRPGDPPMAPDRPRLGLDVAALGPQFDVFVHEQTVAVRSFWGSGRPRTRKLIVNN